MSELLQLLGLLAVVFSVCLVGAYLFSRSREKKPTRLVIDEGTSVRVIAPDGVYRCHSQGSNGKGLTFSSPLQRDSYVPLRVGDSVMIQLARPGGLLSFRTTILDRNATTHQFTVAYPTHLREMDRRSEIRDRSFEGVATTVNGEIATMIDLSAGGAKVIARDAIMPGDQVRIDLPHHMGTVYGWALECSKGATPHPMDREVRVRFEEPLTGLQTLRRKTLHLEG